MVQDVSSSALFDGTKWPKLKKKSIDTIQRTVATATKKIGWSRKCLQRRFIGPDFLARNFFPFEHVNPVPMRLLGPCPTPTFQQLHLTLDNQALYEIVVSAGQQAWLPKGNCVAALINQGYFANIRSITSQENPNGKHVFTGIITTNGHAMTAVYAKKKPSQPQLQLTLQDFEPWDLPFLSPWAVDRGDRDLITSVNDCNPHMFASPAFAPSEADLKLPRLPHRVRSFSSVEYRRQILKTQKQMQRWKRKAGIGKVESAIPTYRTVFAKSKFNTWRQCQIQNDEVVNILINGGGKYKQDPPVANDTRKLHVVFYGAANIGISVFKGRKTQAGLSKKSQGCLQKDRCSIPFAAVEVDEYLTSQVCSRCATRSLNHVKRIQNHINGYFFTNEETITITMTKHIKKTREELDEEKPGRVLGTTVSSSCTHDDEGSSRLHVLTTIITSNQPTFTSALAPPTPSPPPPHLAQPQTT
ncbi:hypothetical protein DM01DRAFT_327634 [Hesseltinella vesiculosa]|uniref:Uncharacterized protein n=1 Tax=Hesseltinella vesiculosa TaxID=101127 RepID=A0A1X2GLI2_9FUNG|nr:hypothetical protein DM01DRAFT_327634 [Hesseltinella vesiculosa]